jgi:peptidoglycan lytic transglycosylase G
MGRERPRRRAYAGLIVAVALAAVVFACAYGGISVGTQVFSPAGPAGAPAQRVVVHAGDTTAQIADELQQQGLIRNALLFRLWARNRGLDRHLQAGVYLISPGQTMNQIIGTLEQAVPSQVVVTVPEGLRVTEYPKYLSALHNFDTAQFLQIAQTGQFAGRDQYWYVMPAPGAQYALEGYLFPSTYYLDPQASAVDVVKTMLNGLGQVLCPGPSNDPNRYIFDQTQCQAHARVVDPSAHLTIFGAMAQRHLTLQQALTLASIVQREARSAQAKAGVASVYYNRFLAASGIQAGPDNGGPLTLDADPTVQYATGTAQNPWPTLQDQARNIDPTSAYNTYTHIGLPPSPIAGSGLDVLVDVVDAPRTDYYYFITGSDNQMHFAHTYQQQQQNITQYGVG